MLDVRTLIVVGAGLALASGGVLWAVARVSPYRGPGHWAASCGLIGTGFLLVALRGVIPDWISIVVANSLAFAGCVALWSGSRAFATQRPVSPLWIAAALAPFVPLLATVTMLGTITERTVVVLAACAVAVFAAAVDLMRRGGERLVTRTLLIGLLVVHATMLLARLVLTPLAGSAPLFVGGGLAQLQFLETVLFIPISCVLFTAMVAEKAVRAVAAQALYDSVGGHFNAAGFAMMMDKELARGRRESSPMTVLVSGFDAPATFDALTAGPDAEDRFQAICRGTLREQDILGRLADGRYGVILPNTHLEDGLRIAHRLRAAFLGGGGADAVRPVAAARSLSVGAASVVSGVAAGGNVLAAAREAQEQAALLGGNRVERATTPVALAFG